MADVCRASLICPTRGRRSSAGHRPRPLNCLDSSGPSRVCPAVSFRRASGVAGEFLQNLVNHRLRLAVIGDLSALLEGSEALRDFVRESNRGSHAWFLADEAELERRLGGH